MPIGFGLDDPNSNMVSEGPQSIRLRLTLFIANYFLVRYPEFQYGIRGYPTREGMLRIIYLAHIENMNDKLKMIKVLNIQKFRYGSLIMSLFIFGLFIERIRTF